MKDVGEELSGGVFFAGWDLPRGKDSIRCLACNKGYAEEVECTEDECAEYGCFRDSPGYECCACAFLCVACGARNVGKREAPEYN